MDSLTTEQTIAMLKKGQNALVTALIKAIQNIEALNTQMALITDLVVNELNQTMDNTNASPSRTNRTH